MPSWLQRFWDWGARPEVLVPLTVGSGVLLVISAVGLPQYLQRLPPDYFSRQERPHGQQQSALRVVTSVLRNVVGGLLVLCGVLMLVLPGQGILTLLAGLMILDFPGKKSLERRVLSFRSVQRAVNGMRARAGKPPFQLPA